MSNLRRAASVLLTRPKDGGVEVYLVERSKRLRFFGGYLALPGGVLGPEDAHDDAETALRACALRELFEETGVLLPPLAGQVEDHERDPLRADLLRPKPRLEAWRALMAKSDAPLDALTSICDLTTPEFAPVRYATRFFLAALPPHEWPTIVRGELTDGAFWAPGEALRVWLEGEVLIAPPVLHLLRVLDAHGPEGFISAMEKDAASFAAGHLHPVYFTPGVLLAALRTPTVPPATTTNTYVVGHRRLFVVDPATPYPDEQARLFGFLDGLRDEGRELAGILVTHHHEDHIGAVAATSQRYTLPVHAHPLTLERLPPGIADARPLGDGDRLELDRAPDGSEDWHLRALHTPGHDRGHLAFLESRYRTAIVGDLCSTMSTIVIDPPEGHLATYLASLRRLLAEEEITTLYPAHGPARRDGEALLREYLAHRAEREEALLRALAKGPSSLGDLLPQVYDDVEESVYPLAARSLLAGIEKLVEEGRAVAVGEGAWQLRP